ncbi:MAG: thiamine pyrophosphate-binding protein [Chloroflexi bacterium]|nr:thiamine pyrophosphate-binding protein [Chloroflexota bacterium]
MQRTGADIIAEYLVRERVPFAAGIPGHGIWTLVDAMSEKSPNLRLIPVMHEQSAVHLADGYYRATGRPLAAFTSIGPGATNTVVGVATAYSDSTAVLLMTGSTHTYMRGHTVLQEIDRVHDANNARIFEPVVKRWWQPSSVEVVPYVIQRAFAEMLSGRPGPVLLDLPMDVQADAADVEVPDPCERRSSGRLRADPQLIEQAASLLRSAQRPVIVAGGGVITAEASEALVRVAERLGAAVVTTWMGKGAISEEHELNGWSIGDTASTSGNALAASADVILAVGCRFTDWSASSYRPGVTFSIPPTKLVQIDIDSHELGKNYPVAAGIQADARAALEDLLTALDGARTAWIYRDSAWYQQIQRERQRWERVKAERRDVNVLPMTQQRAVAELRAALSREAIVTTGAGVVQAVVRQDFPIYEPRTHITSGGFSTMGFTVPAALGAQLAFPDREVVGIAGDGDFMQTMQEMAVAAMQDLPVLFVVLNNSGWISIKGGQLANFGRLAMTDFLCRDGSVYSPDFAAIARNFGLHGERIDQPEEIIPAVKRARATRGPALLEITVARDFPLAGTVKTGWWDVPVPPRLSEQRATYEQGRQQEQMR